MLSRDDFKFVLCLGWHPRAEPDRVPEIRVQTPRWIECLASARQIEHFNLIGMRSLPRLDQLALEAADFAAPE